MSVVSGWRLALRLAWRDAVRSRARSALVLVMVTLPVVAVTAADVIQATSSVNSVEGLDRRLGTAQARVESLTGTGVVDQLPDPDDGGFITHGSGHGRAGLGEIEKTLGGTRPTVEMRTRGLDVRTHLGGVAAQATGIDLRDPLTAGLFRLTSGRLPSATDEVVINQSLADHGFAVGDSLPVSRGPGRVVVGIAESTATRTQPLLVGPLDSLPATKSERSWLLGGSPVTWDQVRAVNRLGATVLSREVIEHPPSTAGLPPAVRAQLSSDRSQTYAVLALIGVMALLEVVLLAGPAFAVGARRQSRTLALIAANGGNPSQARRTVLASAIVLGSVGAVTGSLLGIGLARLLLPSLQGLQDTPFGPFQLRGTHLAAIAAFGVLSAFLAAVVPAWIASRQDVVAVLAGRRGDRAASRRSPFIGVVLLGLGVLGAVLGARQGGGELLIAGSAVVSVFGMIFLVPVVVLAVARLGRGLPLPLRYAVRDAARHRTRTVPAVAAVAATVAGVVALAIGNTSDQTQARADYQPMLQPGVASISFNNSHTDPAQMRSVVSRIVPGVQQTTVVGVKGAQPISARTVPADPGALTPDFYSTIPAQLLVSDGGTLPPLLDGVVDAAQWERASQVLAHGGALMLTSRPTTASRVRLHESGPSHPVATVPATFVPTAHAPVLGVVAPSLAQRLGLTVRTSGLILTGGVSRDQEAKLDEVARGLDSTAYVYVERGYQTPGSEKVVLWILFGMASVLMLGGTLTATFLALSDARPDLATLSAVGASPRTRRGVAAAYAVAVGLVGAVLGAAVGFIPGIAITYPLTRGFEPGSPSHYLDIPWLLIGALVLALPLLTAAVVGLVARSRLPVVARLD